ncbi:hypothetical protein [Streptomyces sp. NPDC101145]|uniref:hypothetical protein n=1 Tax=Streptomyces sp. NPDC101145 TaxID=3366112 RepID=UPI00381910A7
MTATDPIQAAADAVRAHQQSPDTHTLRDMQTKVQDALNQGATLQDIAHRNS